MSGSVDIYAIEGETKDGQKFSRSAVFDGNALDERCKKDAIEVGNEMIQQMVRDLLDANVNNIAVKSVSTNTSAIFCKRERSK